MQTVSIDTVGPPSFVQCASRVRARGGAGAVRAITSAPIRSSWRLSREEPRRYLSVPERRWLASRVWCAQLVGRAFWLAGVRPAGVSNTDGKGVKKAVEDVGVGGSVQVGLGKGAALRTGQEQVGKRGFFSGDGERAQSLLVMERLA